MAKENGELLRVFNEYLNKQESKAVAPNESQEENLHESDYRLKMSGEENQIQDNERYLDFQLLQNDEDVDDLEREAVVDEKLHNIRPEKLTDEERYKKMKNLIKSVKIEGIVNGMLSIDDMMEWAMSTAVIDGASDEFMDIIVAMKGIKEIFNKYAAAWNKYQEMLEKRKNGQATDEEVDAASLENKTATKKCQDKYYALARKAHKYVDSHDGSKWSDKGKSRLAFANYILSSNFVEKYVVKLTKDQLESQKFTDDFDGNAFIIAYELQQGGIKVQTAIYNDVFDGNKHVKERLTGFPMGSVERLPSRGLYNQVKMLFSEEAMAAERSKVVNAMSAYIGKEVVDDDEDFIISVVANKEPLFSMLDDVVEEVCNFKITEDLFNKSYYIKHPEELIRLRRITQLTGDCLDESGNVALGECGKEYLDSLKGSTAYTKFYTKLNFITHLWFTIIDYLLNSSCFHVESMLNESTTTDSIIETNHFEGAAREDYDPEEYANYVEAHERSAKDWMNIALDQAKRDYHFNDDMKRYLNSSIFSSIRVPRRNVVNNRRK